MGVEPGQASLTQQVRLMAMRHAAQILAEQGQRLAVISPESDSQPHPSAD